MAMMIKILKSDSLETEERQVERLKKEIVFLTEDLQTREKNLERLKIRTQE